MDLPGSHSPESDAAYQPTSQCNKHNLFWRKELESLKDLEVRTFLLWWSLMVLNGIDGIHLTTAKMLPIRFRLQAGLRISNTCDLSNRVLTVGHHAAGAVVQFAEFWWRPAFQRHENRRERQTVANSMWMHVNTCEYHPTHHVCRWCLKGARSFQQCHFFSYGADYEQWRRVQCDLKQLLQWSVYISNSAGMSLSFEHFLRWMRICGSGFMPDVPLFRHARRHHGDLCHFSQQIIADLEMVSQCFTWFRV